MRTLRRVLLPARRSFYVVGYLITCFTLGASTPLLAQGGRAEINGTVTDAQKAVLPGVTVTVTNEDTGLMREEVTDGAGRFVIPQLVPGPYTVKAELSGFQPMKSATLLNSFVDCIVPICFATRCCASQGRSDGARLSRRRHGVLVRPIALQVSAAI